MASKLTEIADENRKKIIETIVAYDKGEGVTWNILLEKTGLAKATLAKHLKRLINEGLIIEVIDRKDRRIKHYKINEKGFEELKKDLLSLNLAFWIYSSLVKLYNDYKDKIVKCGNDYDCLNEVMKEFINKIRGVIADFVLMCLPNDIYLFCSAMWFVSMMSSPTIDNIREIVINEDAMKSFEEMKKKDAKTLFNDIKEGLYKFIVAWTSLAQTTPEEMQKVIEKYYDKDIAEIAYKNWLIMRENAIRALDVIKNTWIGKAIKVNPDDIKSFEDIVKLENRNSKFDDIVKNVIKF